MGRVNVFLEASNERRTIVLGGRGASDSINCLINTDNATKSDCGLRISAMVTGTLRAKERAKSGDDRKSVFQITLPDQADENCEVHINAGGNGVPKVVLPTGITLAYALECVEQIKKMKVIGSNKPKGLSEVIAKTTVKTIRQLANEHPELRAFDYRKISLVKKVAELGHELSDEGKAMDGEYSDIKAYYNYTVRPTK